MQTEADAIALFGAGSELHRMVRAFLKINKSTSLYAAPVHESSGSKATLAITITGPATGNGTVRCFVGADPIDTGFVNGDSATTIAANMATNINANANLGVTANASVGVLTLTAKQKGLRGNWLRGSAIVLNGSGVTSDTVSQVFFTGGTTADSNTNVLNFLATNGLRYYYQVSAAEDATQFGALATQINTLAAPIVGLRQRCVAGSVDTLSNAITIATGINSARAECVWMQNSDVPPAELATIVTAVYSLFEATPLSAANGVNFDGFGNDAKSGEFWSVPAPIVGTAASRTSIKSALNNGLTPLQVQKAGRTSLVKRVTTRSLNGAVNDYRIADAGKVTICDYFADDLYNILTLQFGRKLIGNDPAQGQPSPAPGVITPSLVRPTIVNLINFYANLGLIDGPSVIKGLVVQRESAPTSRMTARVPLFTNDPLHQFGIAIDQVA